jgi:hypothetical protein
VQALCAAPTQWFGSEVPISGGGRRGDPAHRRSAHTKRDSDQSFACMELNRGAGSYCVG